MENTHKSIGVFKASISWRSSLFCSGFSNSTFRGHHTGPTSEGLVGTFYFLFFFFLSFGHLSNDDRSVKVDTFTDPTTHTSQYIAGVSYVLTGSGGVHSCHVIHIVLLIKHYYGNFNWLHPAYRELHTVYTFILSKQKRKRKKTKKNFI